MKNNSIARFARILFLVFFFQFSLNLIAHEPWYVNGRIINQVPDFYYVETDLGSTLILDVNFLTVKFKSGAEDKGLKRAEQELGLTYIGTTNANYYVLHNNFWLADYPDYFVALNGFPEVEKTFISYLGQFDGVKPNPNDFGNVAWYIGENLEGSEGEFLDLPDAWMYTTGDSKIKIGIIDSGLSWGDDLPNDNFFGHNFANLLNPNITEPDLTSPYIDNTHGTQVASIICSKTNNGYKGWGVAGGWKNPDEGDGVTPIMVVNGNVIGGYDLNGAPKYGWSTALTPLCIDWAINNGARVINMSFGIAGLLPDEELPIKEAIDGGIGTEHDAVFIAAAGNYKDEIPRGVNFPGNYEPVISVGGTNMDNLRVDFFDNGSCFGPGLDFVSAWGVYTNDGTNNLVQSGTSCSAALLSGVVGLMLSANPCLSSSQVYNILKQSCNENPNYTFTNGWNENVGFGFVSARKALELSIGYPDIIITGTETWNSDRQYNGNITIASGGKLILQNMTLRMNDNTSINVDRGGELDIDGATVTSACISLTGFWQGIKIDGDAWAPQVPYTNQGRVVIKNHSIVSNAIIALEATRPEYNHGGGIVQATNSEFVNNKYVAFWGPYHYGKSVSSFSYCNFIINSEYAGSPMEPNQPFITMQFINNISFKACKFENALPESEYANRGIGINTYCANYSITGVCTAQPPVSPCPDDKFDKSQFTNLLYGIYSLNNGVFGKTKIAHSDFHSNNCGLYVSNVDYLDLLTNHFLVPGDQDPDPRGAYLENCTGYHVENNVFEGIEGNNKIDEIGIYILNSQGAQNYVYNNYFYQINRGAVADGANRNSEGTTGLCYKCNTFQGVNLDIDIQRQSGTDLKKEHGIALYQGSPFLQGCNEPDTLAAGNIFTIGPGAYNIRNINNEVYYFHHESSIPINLPLIPEIVSDKVYKFPVEGTIYYRPKSCRSWINTVTKPKAEMILDKNLAKIAAENIESTLSNTVDGGNTESLNSDILGSIPLDAVSMRDELIQKSPYLSDTVMKNAIDKENVLTNSMLRDILVVNPQSAKTIEVMDKLQERFEPMPDYMVDEIQAGANTIGDKEMLEASRDNWRQMEGLLFCRIVADYLEDTINPAAKDELKSYLQEENSTLASFTLTDLYLQESDYSSAIQALNSIQNNSSISNYEQEEVSAYNALINILVNLQAEGIPLNKVDSIHALPLIAIYNLGCTKPYTIAKNILIESGLIQYHEPINGNDITKSAKAQTSDVGHKLNQSKSNVALRVFPNPAKYFLTAEYTLPSNALNASLIIRNTEGITMKELVLTKNLDQKVVEVKSLPAGIYMLSLVVNGKLNCSTSLSIIK